MWTKRRRLLTAVLVVSVVAGTALIAYRVLAPAEVSIVGPAALPASPNPHARLIGRYSAAPLFADGRVRVYATKRQVRADGPVDGTTQNTPRWSYRRWPAQVTAVSTVGATVVTRWSDGRLVGLSAADGRVVWRLDGPAGGVYNGRRTGSAVVWNPVYLHPSGDAVLALAGGRLRSVDAATGTVGWDVAVPPDCTDGFVSAGGRFHCLASGATYSPAGQPLAGWPTGPLTPLGCSVAASACQGVRDGAGRGWLLRGPVPLRAPALDPAGTMLDVTGHFVLPTAPGTTITAKDPVTGTERWTIGDSRTTYRVLATQQGTVHLLVGRNELYNLDLATGRKRSSLMLRVDWESDKWLPNVTYAADGFLAVERVSLTGKPADDDHGYYFQDQNVIMAATV